MISYTEAKAYGLKRYWGRRCLQGHDGVRYTSNRRCVQCSAAARQRWGETEAGRECTRAISRDWRSRHLEKAREMTREATRRWRAERHERREGEQA